jgi:hypothetical protein
MRLKKKSEIHDSCQIQWLGTKYGDGDTKCVKDFSEYSRLGGCIQSKLNLNSYCRQFRLEISVLALHNISTVTTGILKGVLQRSFPLIESSEVQSGG